MAAALARGGVVAIVLAMLLGPWFSLPEYSWQSHTTSELAGQNMPGAWIMRAGFAAYGAGVVAASLLTLRQAPYVRLALVVFGAGLVGAALWPTAPIDPALDFDPSAAFLHSVFANITGAAFAAACAARLFAPGGNMLDSLSWLGLAASVLVPLMMLALPNLDGALQRLMFGVSLVWIWREFHPQQEQRGQRA